MACLRVSAATTLAGVLAALCAGCTETVKETYDIDIIGAPDAFTGVSKVSLFAKDVEVATAMLTGNGPFSLAWRDVNPLQTSTVYFEIKAVDASGVEVSRGRSPEVEVLNASTKIRVFVQRPGTLVASRELERKLQGHFALSAETLRTSGSELTLPMAAPLFGTGRERVGTGDSVEAFSNELYVYNPVTHLPERLGQMQGPAQSDTASLSPGDANVFIFGGRGRDAGSVSTSARLDVVRVGRRPLSNFEIADDLGVQGPPETARSRAVMVQAGRPQFVFGGVDADDIPLDDVVNIDLQGRPTEPIIRVTHSVSGAAEPLRMSAPRVGHSASLVTVPAVEAMGSVAAIPARSQVLVFGGAPAGGSVADLFDAQTQTFVPVDRATAGTGRRDHAALAVTMGGLNRLLILGGRGDDGAARGDSLLYDPATQRFTAGPINLRTARSNFTVFTVGSDLVVVGGLGPDRQPLPNAEIYALGDLSFVGVIPAAARANATATPLANVSVLVLGGTTADSSSSAVEIYQPRLPAIPKSP